MKRKQVVRYNEEPTINFIGLENTNLYQNLGIICAQRLIAQSEPKTCCHIRSREWFKFPIIDELETFFLYNGNNSKYYIFYGYRIRIDFFDTNVLLEIGEKKYEGLGKIEVKEKLIKHLKERGYITETIGDREFINIRKEK